MVELTTSADGLAGEYYLVFLEMNLVENLPYSANGHSLVFLEMNLVENLPCSANGHSLVFLESGGESSLLS